MSDFRDYKVIEELASDPRSEIVLARKAGAKRNVLLKSLKLDALAQGRSILEETRILTYEELKGDPRIHHIDAIKAQGAAGRLKDSNVAPIHDLFPTDEGVCFATDYYQNGALKKRIRLIVPNHPALQNVIGGILRGLSSLKSAANRGHGNLHTNNVMLAGGPKTPLRDCRIFLTDVAPVSSKATPALEIDDLRSVGQILYQLVTRRVEDRKDDFPFPVRPSPEWEALGEKGEFWLRICNRLLDPDLAPGSESLEALLEEIGRPRSSRPILIAAGLVVAGLAVFGVWWIMPPRPPSVVFISPNPASGPFIGGSIVTWILRIDHAATNATGLAATSPQTNLTPRIEQSGDEYKISVELPTNYPGKAEIDFTAGGFTNGAIHFTIEALPLPPPAPPPELVSITPDPASGPFMAGSKIIWTLRIANAAPNAPKEKAKSPNPGLNPIIKPDGGQYTISLEVPTNTQGACEIDFSAGGLTDKQILFTVAPLPAPVLLPGFKLVFTNPPLKEFPAGSDITWRIRIDHAVRNAPEATARSPQTDLHPSITADGDGYKIFVNVPTNVDGACEIHFSAGGLVDARIPFTVTPLPAPVLLPGFKLVFTNPPLKEFPAGSDITWRIRVDHAVRNAPEATARSPQTDLHPSITADGDGYKILVNVPTNVDGACEIDFSAGGLVDARIPFAVKAWQPPPAPPPPTVDVVSNPAETNVTIGQAITWQFKVNNPVSPIGKPDAPNFAPKLEANDGVYTLTATPGDAAPIGKAAITISDGAKLKTNFSFYVVAPPAPTIKLMSAGDTNVEAGKTITWTLSIDVGDIPKRPDLTFHSTNPEFIADKNLSANWVDTNRGTYTLELKAPTVQKSTGHGEITVEARVWKSKVRPFKLTYNIQPVPPLKLERAGPFQTKLAANAPPQTLRFVVGGGNVPSEKLNLLNFSIKFDRDDILEPNPPIQTNGANREVTLTRLPGKSGKVRITATVMAEDRPPVSIPFDVEVQAPALEILGDSEKTLDVNKPDKEVAKFDCRALDFKSVRFEVVGISPSNTNLLSPTEVEFLPSPDDPGKGSILLKPHRGFVGKATVSLKASAEDATATNFSISLTVNGELKLPTITADPSDITLEQDDTNDIAIRVSDPYFSLTNLAWAPNATPDVQKVISLATGPQLGNGETAIVAKGVGTVAVEFNVGAPNGKTNTTLLNVTVKKAQPPGIDPPEGPILYAQGVPISFKISDNVTPADKIRLAFRDISNTSPTRNWSTNTNFLDTNLVFNLTLSKPPSEDATNQQFEIIATDLAGHSKTNQFEVVFRVRPMFYTNAFTGMVLVWVKDLPETLGTSWPDGRSNGGWVGQCEVTQGEFERVLSRNPSVHKAGTNYPVENITLDDAKEFCSFLTLKESNLPQQWSYTLPTEQQWMYLAAGTDTNEANILETHLGNTTNVASFKPNRLDLYDVFGNVCELTATAWSLDAKVHVYKGGSFDRNKSTLTPDWLGYIPKPPNKSIGFRVVLTPEKGH